MCCCITSGRIHRWGCRGSTCFGDGPQQEGLTEGEAEKLNEANKFYNELYAYEEPCQESLAKVIEALQERTLATPEVCEKPISHAEVLEAIKLTKRGKAPGSDGLPYECYKQHAEELVIFYIQLSSQNPAI